MRSFYLFLCVIISTLAFSSCKKDSEPVPIPNIILTGEKIFEIFDTTMILNGIELTEGLEGKWQVIQSSDAYWLSDSSNNECEFIGSLLGNYTLRWTVSNGEEEKSEDIQIKIIGFTDSRDDIEYRAIKIGNQIWMAENLECISYQNGDPIIDGSTVGDYSNENNPKYWFAYNDDVANINTYGRLYTWYAVADSRGISPKGWHVPNDSEWNLLQFAMGMDFSQLDSVCNENNLIGSRLKEVGTTHWNLPNLGATDEYHFKALPAGYRRRFDKNFEFKGEYACFWTTTSSELNYENAWYRHLYFDKENICRSNNYKNYGFSVRCVKN
jgi:uncharacterized protein (TIGR02145 family)